MTIIHKAELTQNLATNMNTQHAKKLGERTERHPDIEHMILTILQSPVCDEWAAMQNKYQSLITISNQNGENNGLLSETHSIE